MKVISMVVVARLSSRDKKTPDDYQSFVLNRIKSIVIIAAESTCTGNSLALFRHIIKPLKLLHQVFNHSDFCCSFTYRKRYVISIRVNTVYIRPVL